MQTSFHRRHLHFWIGGLCAVLCIAGKLANTSAADTPKVKIALAGDSTVTDKAGWGEAFAGLLRNGAECVNLARGGQSSRSFYKSNWKKVLEQKPTYVLIQFGHNDQPGKGPERETEPETTYRDFLIKFVDESREVGAKPILVTSLVRRVFTPEGKIREDLDPYASAMRKVAKEKNVPLVDLHARSKELMERLGPAKSEAFGPKHPKLADKVDGTHLNEYGAKEIAPIIARELANAEPSLRPYLPESAKSAIESK
jgi:lysophospholipase L1-like esterase